MRFHALCHVPFEGPAGIASWIQRRGHNLQQTALWNAAPLPSVNDFDFLIVMGGSMNIYEERDYPWLKDEKILIEKAIAAGRRILGVCLGAQLIADVLGGKVYKNKEKEIGWLPVEILNPGKNLLSGLSSSTVFQWHGDTFYLPQGAVQLARTEACEQQAFLYDGRVLGLQFHIESTPESILFLVENCKNELVPGKFIQSENEILSNRKYYPEFQKALDQLLDLMVKHEDAGRASKVTIS